MLRQGPLVLLHGFTHTGASWQPVVRALGASYRALRPDLPDSFEACRALLDEIVPEGAVLCGYSMGGRVALDWAVRRTPSLARLVLISASPGLADEGERRDRRAADEALAERIEAMTIDQFVREWEANPVLEGSPAWLREERLRHSPAHLAAQLRGLGLGVMEPLWDRLPPGTEWVVGERDEKFRAIAARTGQCVHVVPGAGHAVHAERPEAVAALLRDAPSA